MILIPGQIDAEGAIRLIVPTQFLIGMPGTVFLEFCGQPGVDVHLFFLDVGERGILFQESLCRIAYPGFQLGIVRTVVYKVFGRLAARLHALKLYEVKQFHALRSNPEVNLQQLIFACEMVKDVVRATDGNKFADVVSQVLVKKARKVLPQRSKVLQNPELADFLGESEGVVFCGDSVVGFLHSVFVLVRIKDAGVVAIYHPN